MSHHKTANKPLLKDTSFESISDRQLVRCVTIVCTVRLREKKDSSMGLTAQAKFSEKYRTLIGFENECKPSKSAVDEILDL